MPEFVGELPTQGGSYTDGISKNHWLQIALLLDRIEIICFSTTPLGIFGEGEAGECRQRWVCGVGVFLPEIRINLIAQLNYGLKIC